MMAEVLCVYREVQVLKKAVKKPGKPVAIVSYDEKPGIQGGTEGYNPAAYLPYIAAGIVGEKLDFPPLLLLMRSCLY